MTTDLITWVDSSFRTIPKRDARTLMGQSMGAMGSFRYGILHKEKFRALAAHAGCLDFFDPFWFDEVLTRLHKENQPGPPYFYDILRHIQEETGHPPSLPCLMWFNT